jgi:hypothetical protein
MTPYREYLQRQKARSYRPGQESPSPGVLKRAWNAFGRARDTYPLAFITGLRKRWLLWGLAVAYVVSIASVLLLSPFQEEPSLPRVTFDDPEDGSREAGLLLSHHADGRWYILHTDVNPHPQTFEAEGQWDTELLAIPDDVAGEVRFLRADPETVYAHKGESVESGGILTYYSGDTIRIVLEMRDDESEVLSAHVGLFKNIDNCRSENVKPAIDEEFELFRDKVKKSEDKDKVKKSEDRDKVEEGESNKIIKIEVTNEKIKNGDIPTGEYVCERIKVTDAASKSNSLTRYRDIRFWVKKDKVKPELQGVQITK